MINAEIEEEEEGQYPMLMIYPDDGTIILATGVGDNGYHGTCVLAKGISQVGQMSKGWNKHKFKPFHGKLTL
nr:hypothetical protein [Gammaproteobacteria bacterium]NIX59905.1 hypothetical protein [candidate division Zixibacteria bacterium]